MLVNLFGQGKKKKNLLRNREIGMMNDQQHASRYGDESRLSSFMGVIQAIISFFQDSDDTIK